MSTSWIVLYPKNLLLPSPAREQVFNGLKAAGFVEDKDHKWKNPDTGETEIFYKAGKNYIPLLQLDPNDAYTREDAARTVIEFKQHEKIEIEVYGPGDFVITNPATGTVMHEDWGSEVGAFLEDPTHQWTDPADGKKYSLFELECKDFALGNHFIKMETGWGTPGTELLELMREITGQEYKWIYAKT